MEEKGDVCIIDLRNTVSGFERGCIHGKILKKEINIVRDLWRKLLKSVSGSVRARIKDALVQKLLVRFYQSSIPSEYREEMRGIAFTSGVPEMFIWTINIFDDVFRFWMQRPWLRRVLEAYPARVAA